MNYEDWEAGVPIVFKEDSLWKMKVCRHALFAADLGWHDVTKLMKDWRTVGLSDQLYRALGSVSANIAEGYPRGTGKDPSALLRIRPRIGTRKSRLVLQGKTSPWRSCYYTSFGVADRYYTGFY